MTRSRWSRIAALAAVAWLGLAGGARAQQEQADRARAVTAGDEVEVVDTTEGLGLDESQKIHIRVTNDLVPTRSVTVSVVGGTRPEYVLGALLSNQSKEWIVDSRAFAGGMRLIASSGARDVRISRQIDVTNFARVRWGLNTDIVRVERQAASGDTR